VRVYPILLEVMAIGVPRADVLNYVVFSRARPRRSAELPGPVGQVAGLCILRPAEAYEFSSDPRNLPRWAAGLARSEVRRDGDE
jgi:hypothetical protein